MDGNHLYPVPYTFFMFFLSAESTERMGAELPEFVRNVVEPTEQELRDLVFPEWALWACREIKSLDHLFETHTALQKMTRHHGGTYGGYRPEFIITDEVIDFMAAVQRKEET